MPIQFQCPCGRVLKALEDLQGKKVRCPQCGNPVMVPAVQTPPPPPPPPARPKAAAPPPSPPAPPPRLQLTPNAPPPPQGATIEPEKLHAAAPSVPSAQSAAAAAPIMAVLLPNDRPPSAAPLPAVPAAPPTEAMSYDPVPIAKPPKPKGSGKRRTKSRTTSEQPNQPLVWLKIIGTSLIPLALGIIYFFELAKWEKEGAKESKSVPRIVALGYELGGLYGVPVVCGLISVVAAAVQIKLHLDGNAES